MDRAGVYACALLCGDVCPTAVGCRCVAGTGSIHYAALWILGGDSRRIAAEKVGLVVLRGHGLGISAGLRCGVPAECLEPFTGECT